MAPYPILRMPEVRLSTAQIGTCYFHPEVKLTTALMFPHLARCLECDCECLYRKEDMWYNDALVFPCELHIPDLPPFEPWPETLH